MGGGQILFFATHGHTHSHIQLKLLRDTGHKVDPVWTIKATERYWPQGGPV
jgi:hypothetical protein